MVNIVHQHGRCAFDFDDDYVHIYDLYVEPEKRNQGIGRTILRSAIDMIRATGWAGPIAIVANPNDLNIDRERLKLFYESMGLTVYEYYGNIKVVGVDV